MELSNEDNFPHTGVIDFVDNKIAASTATLRFRGVFPNRDGALRPGSFAKFRVAGQELKDAVMVIDDAVGTDQDKRFLYILNSDNTIERRSVQVGPLIGELRVVTANLKPDEVVIVNGIANLVMVRPGGKVDPTVTEMPEHRLVAATTRAAATSTSTAPAATGTAPATTEGGK